MENKDKSQEPVHEHSWTPVSFENGAHSKMDWMDEVHFRYVRGVEVHSEEELEAMAPEEP